MDSITDLFLKAGKDLGHEEATYENTRGSNFENYVRGYFNRLIGDWHEVYYDIMGIIRNPRGAEMELDIYYPGLALAVEVNALNWHVNKLPYKYDGFTIGYHAYKKLACEEKGIHLIYIWDYEWDEHNGRPYFKKDLKIKEELINLGIEVLAGED